MDVFVAVFVDGFVIPVEAVESAWVFVASVDDLFVRAAGECLSEARIDHLRSKFGVHGAEIIDAGYKLRPTTHSGASQRTKVDLLPLRDVAAVLILNRSYSQSFSARYEVNRLAGSTDS